MRKFRHCALLLIICSFILAGIWVLEDTVDLWLLFILGFCGSVLLFCVLFCIVSDRNAFEVCMVYVFFGYSACSYEFNMSKYVSVQLPFSYMWLVAGFVALVLLVYWCFFPKKLLGLFSIKNMFEFVLVVFVSYSAIAGLFGIYPLGSVNHVLSYVLISFCILKLFWSVFEDKSEKIENVFLVVYVVTLIIIWKTVVAWFIDPSLVAAGGALDLFAHVGRLHGLHCGVSHIGEVLLLNLLLGIGLFLLKRSFCYLLQVPLSFVMLILTVKRSAIVAFIFVMLLCVFLYRDKRQRVFVRRIFVLLALFIPIGFVATEHSQLLLRYFSRGAGYLSDDSGRLFIWIHYVGKALSRNLVMGIGLGNVDLFLQTEQAGIGNLHNMFIEILVSTGIVGLALYVLCIYLMLQRLYRNYRIACNSDSKSKASFLFFLILPVGCIVNGCFEAFFPGMLGYQVSFFCVVASDLLIRKIHIGGCGPRVPVEYLSEPAI